MEAESFEACVTDPPYELGFMGKSWDESGIAFDPEFWKEVYRVLKPGAHLLSFGGTRTHHRMMVAIENAGFEIRDTLTWHYGGGFPKATDMSKTIDRRKGKSDERKKVGERSRNVKPFDDSNGWNENSTTGDFEYTEAATEEAKKWEGWKTGLKPATEFICMARKPFNGATVDAVLKHGVGALNIDDCRIGFSNSTDKAKNPSLRDSVKGGNGGKIIAYEEESRHSVPSSDGRYPANLLMDDRASALMDDQSGELYSASAVYGTEDGGESLFGSGEGGRKTDGHDATGGASRFFYCPKASTSERNMGVEENNHPTVKPVELMGYLIRLVTPEGGKVLDPFGGSGTTGMAAVLEQKEFVLVEKDEGSVNLAQNRIEYVENNYQRVREKIYGDPSNSITEEETEVNDHEFW